MFLHQGVWFPDGEKHFPEWMDKNGEIVDGKGTYQIKKWRACIPHIKQWRCAVDVGGHVGLWSMQMAKKFQRVEAFEPVVPFVECYLSNLTDADSIVRHTGALGAAPGVVRITVNPADTGGSHVGEVGQEAQIFTLDSFGFKDVDFLKIDCEGYEHHVIEGARETLLRCKPCVIVEQKQHIMGRNYGAKGTPAVDMLREMGAVLRQEIGGDYILSWP